MALRYKTHRPETKVEPTRPNSLEATRHAGLGPLKEYDTKEQFGSTADLFRHEDTLISGDCLVISDNDAPRYLHLQPLSAATELELQLSYKSGDPKRDYSHRSPDSKISRSYLIGRTWARLKTGAQQGRSRAEYGISDFHLPKEDFETMCLDRALAKGAREAEIVPMRAVVHALWPQADESCRYSRRNNDLSRKISPRGTEAGPRTRPATTRASIAEQPSPSALPLREEDTGTLRLTAGKYKEHEIAHDGPLQQTTISGCMAVTPPAIGCSGIAILDNSADLPLHIKETTTDENAGEAERDEFVPRLGSVDDCELGMPPDQASNEELPRVASGICSAAFRPARTLHRKYRQESAIEFRRSGGLHEKHVLRLWPLSLHAR